MTLPEPESELNRREETVLAPSEALDQTLDADRTRRALIANLRHELRTPINAIIGYSEMLLEDAEQAICDNWISDLNRIHTAGEHLLALLNDILDPAKIEANRVDVTSEAFGAQVRHELRNPLNAIIGYSEMLLESSEEVGEGCFTPDIRRIHTAAKRLLDSLEHIIELSKIEAGQAEFDLKTPGELSVVRNVVATIRSLAEVEVGPAQAEHGSLLVVDDNEMNRDMLSRHLQRQGYELRVAENGREALELICANKFDLVLLDMVMPEMSGYQVLQRLKADDVLRNIPVIMISALDGVDSVVRCIEAGADDYLPKPFNPVLLRARIGACLEKKRLRDREQAYLEELRVEREMSERLLLNVLPQPIAERLKKGEGPIADSFTEATVLFADLVEFTQLSAIVPAKELVALLDDVFSEFDQLAQRYGLEKIKTIGDAYMAAAGIPTPRPDHVEAAAEMSLAMLEATSRISVKTGKPFSIRVGIHTGPVIAGVIGTSKFIYDLWGDTVNTASRMESHGIPDKICITTPVYERLQDRFLFEERGLVQVKAKGLMRVYFLQGRKA